MIYPIRLFRKYFPNLYAVGAKAHPNAWETGIA